MNKFKFIHTSEIESKLEILTRKIKENISCYLGVDIDYLLKDTDSFIFGGAIRDNIADQEMNDVDIIALRKSSDIIIERLKENYYHKFELNSINISTLYTNIKCINEPHTFISQDNESIVQVIIPVFLSREKRLETMIKLLHQVDLSCCGVALSPNSKVIIETCPGAIEDCEKKQFRVLEDNIM